MGNVKNNSSKKYATFLSKTTDLIYAGCDVLIAMVVKILRHVIPEDKSLYPAKSPVL
jgi:hypothetical protein